MIGQTISHYRILEKLGEGGMGVVYKAQDTKLDRLVALKFLPRHLTANESEQARFLQEARAAAALNHANICTIYGVEEYEGQQFIEMEYVDNVTLRKRFESSPLSLNLAAEYAIQIADALQEAHSKGIVHRDIKSDNIMVNSKNQIKVMDFGLAKLKGSLKLTRTSSTVGTLAYMAPEQIQGGEADARSDIFSFGVVLFEMLTGRLPFRGEHEAALVYSIVNEEPESIQNLRTEVSPELVHILNRALEKNPEDRYQTVNEMLIDLRRIRRESTRVSRESVTGRILPSERAPVRRFGNRRVLWFAIPGVLLAAALILLLKPSARISENLVFKPLQIPFTRVWYPGLSSDGNWISFPAMDENNVTEIYYMHASGGEPQRLTHDSVFKFTSDISPDGSQILYTRAGSRRMSYWPLQLMTISTLGGVSRKLADSSNANRWSNDGKSIAFVSVGPHRRGPALWIMNSDGTNKHMIFEDTTGGGRGSRLSIAWSPDDAWIAWLRNFSGPEGRYQEIIIHNLESGKEKQLTFDKKNIDEVSWMAQGEIIFSSNRNGPSNLWAIPSGGGEPVQITKGPGPDMGIKASRDGKRVLYLQQAEFGAIYIADAYARNAIPLTPEDQSVSNPRFSPDGTQVAFFVSDPDPLKSLNHIYVVGRDGKNRRQVTTGGVYIFNFAWSTDSRSIAYSFFDGTEAVRGDSTMKLAIVGVSESDQGNVITHGFINEWTHDGSALNVLRYGTSWRVPLSNGVEEQMFEDSTIVWDSPDGTQQAISDVRVGKRGLWIRTRDKMMKKLVDEPGVYRWYRDGRSVVRIGEARFISTESGRVQSIPWKNPEGVVPSDVSSDWKQTLLVRTRMNATLILIDNFH